MDSLSVTSPNLWSQREQIKITVQIIHFKTAIIIRYLKTTQTKIKKQTSVK